MDLFSYKGSAGDSVVLQVTSQGSLRPCLELVAPDNTRTVACGNAFSQRIDATLSRTGTYTVVVAALSFSGAYTLNLQCLAGPCVESMAPDVAGCLQLQGTPRANRQVILKQTAEPDQTTTTDADGCYAFDQAVSGKRFNVIIKGPLVP